VLRKNAIVIYIIFGLVLNIPLIYITSSSWTFTECVDTENDVLLFSKREYQSIGGYHSEIDITSINISLGKVMLELREAIVDDDLHYYEVNIYWQETDRPFITDSNRTTCTLLDGYCKSETTYRFANGSYLCFSNESKDYLPSDNVILWYYDYSLVENISMPRDVIIRTVFPYSHDFVFDSILPKDNLFVDYYPNDYHSFQTFQTARFSFFTSSVFISLTLLFIFKIYSKKKRKQNFFLQ